MRNKNTEEYWIDTPATKVPGFSAEAEGPARAWLFFLSWAAKVLPGSLSAGTSYFWFQRAGPGER